ncbi:MAG TPA: VCBS repeat-containing protein, partial [Polyangiales bacterium]|nr:VCBS repeat-containing protein [Polyangiales bacterium]
KKHPAADGGETAADGGGTDHDAGMRDDAGMMVCGSGTCMRDQHCVQADPPACEPNTCKMLACSKSQKCVTSVLGAHCEDNTCKDDLDCAASDHCDNKLCMADVCEAQGTTCDKDTVLQCSVNGGEQFDAFSCGSDNPYFTSKCTAQSSSKAGCSCQDDWDCPAYTGCEAGLCQGTGKAPTCLLPALPFSSVLPTPEITWGGVSASDSDARVSSLEPVTPPVAGKRKKTVWPTFAQVVHTPIVINLDDDNGDGLIDERDFPEIVFVAFAGSSYETDGVLRAIHGGGAGKGKDYFVSCGDATWHEGDKAPATVCDDTLADLNSTAVVAAGDLDGDGAPEIVAVLEGSGTRTFGVRIYDHRGDVIADGPVFDPGGVNPGITLANVDNKGLSEIVIGKNVLTLSKSKAGKLSFADRFAGGVADPVSAISIEGPVSCVANLTGDERPEIVVNTQAYRFPKPPSGAKRPKDCVANGGSVTPSTAEEMDFCNGALSLVWDATALNSLTGDARFGMCAIADVLGGNQATAPGPNNVLDGAPEVITIQEETVRIFNGQDGTLKRTISLGAGNDGGPPNVDDFDGDGFPEVGSAFATQYAVVDLQQATSGGECDAWTTAQSDDTMPVSAVNSARTPPSLSCTKDSQCDATGTKFVCNETLGACICLHNGWRRTTEDDSSRVTGSSVFDFNGDGAAEVIYNDECDFRVYDGLSGDVLFKEPSESRTRIEYPVVADVDNDGNAEIVFGTSNESGFCSQGMNDPALAAKYNNGIEVWGDKSDTWVSARRVWNEHAYHITNVTESGAIPGIEPESWKTYKGRVYDSYRSNPRSFGVAPDLVPTALQISTPGGGCAKLDTQMDITVQIENQGDLRIGPGVVVRFYGTWGKTEQRLGDGMGGHLETKIVQSLEPRDLTLLTVTYDRKFDTHGSLPTHVRVVVDATKQERECHEDNNEIGSDVGAETHKADLDITLEQP